MSKPVSQAPTAASAPRHGRLFELIRQHNIAARAATAPAAPAAHDAPQPARRSLLPQEQHALGITASFGR